MLPLLIIVCFNTYKFIITYKKYKKYQLKEVEEKNALLEAERKKNLQMKKELEKLKEQLSNGNNS